MTHMQEAFAFDIHSIGYQRRSRLNVIGVTVGDSRGPHAAIDVIEDAADVFVGRRRVWRNTRRKRSLQLVRSKCKIGFSPSLRPTGITVPFSSSDSLPFCDRCARSYHETA